MSTALAGLLGVIAGAMVTGGVQASLSWLERRREARSSARLLYMELNVAGEGVEFLHEAENWSRISVDFRDIDRTWRAHRERLAHIVGTDDFLKVAAAFSSIAALAQSREKAEQHAPPGLAGAPKHRVPEGIRAGYSGHVEAARVVLAEAAYTWTEKRLGKASLLVRED
jgi:hypothetical protein